MNTSVKDKTRALLDLQTTSGKHKRRKFNDLLARYGIALGGMSVIVAVVLICFYLFWVVLPIFKPAHIELEKDYSWQQNEIQYVGVEEYGEIAFSINNDSEMLFIDTETGEQISRFDLQANASSLSAVSAVDMKGLMVVGFEDGSFQLVGQKYAISYPNDKRKITASIQYPFGEDTFELADSSIKAINAKRWEDGLIVAALTEEGDIVAKVYAVEESFLDDGFTLEEVSQETLRLDFAAKFLLVTEGPDWLYAIGEQGQVAVYRYRDEEWQLNENTQLTSDGAMVTEAVFLLGQSSLMIGDSQGNIHQWFQVRGEDGFLLKPIRQFTLADSAILTIIPEARRKGFIASDVKGNVGIFYSTSERLLEMVSFGQKLQGLAINSRSNKLIAIGENANTNIFLVENEHPEISWSSLWEKVWYESYEEPTFTWQSSASTNDFESKFSLVPLSFGTLKAAFYAMLFAVPLAIFGAIFTAYFMAPRMRGMVKPTVEIMEALPTVILGFLAGLWLAPMVEENLMGILLILILLPILTVLFGLAWNHAPGSIKHRIPDGWQAALLFPVIIFGTMFAFWLGEPLEAMMFDGNMPAWLNAHGINYDQRNSLVVGIAMGFAVIPTIFSITEDAVFSVPKHLTNGSLALGASQWQTMTRVVLPTASPGIFSALMIGLGRAVGETMIVLMATGNTPIMDMNIFEGMRTLSANIAVEMPESELGSTHYRVLFLAAFVLFLFTFVFNTIAEVVRQRLRNKYGSL